ncbi:MAG: fatty acid amide hydrolase 2 [Bradymonadia bacterium]|jgi:fatty acid amide hydrolase 2
MHLIQASARALAQRIRDGETTARAVVQAHIEQARRVNPTINALVHTRFGAALAEAEAVDVARDAGESLPPFAGVPCTIKESFALTGSPHTGGHLVRKGTVASQDAVTVARMRAAGAIPLGVSNTSELCMWMESVNPIYGRSRNPYDARRIVGGSSGGEGAIVGSGASPFGLGSDIGGSIRMPAFFNGVFGHKPTGGLVPCTGQYPAPEGDAIRMLGTGPLTRRAEDLMPMLRVIAGADGADPVCEDHALLDPEAVDFTGRRVVLVPEAWRRVSKDLRRCLRDAADALEARGARVEERSVPLLGKALFIWSARMNAAQHESFGALLTGGAEPKLGRELLRWARRRSPHSLATLGLVGLERVANRLPNGLEKALQEGVELRAHMVELLGDGLWLHPPYTRTAPRHYRPLLTPTDWVNTAVVNALEMPATQVPMGLDKAGLPLGVQVIGSHFQDHVTIAGALALEAAFGGWQLPRQSPKAR